MGDEDQSISKLFSIGNSFHVTLHIHSPKICKQSLQVKIWKAKASKKWYIKAQAAESKKWKIYMLFPSNCSH